MRRFTLNHRKRFGRGFTLIEASLTTVIVATGVLSIIAAQQAYHRKNDWAQRTGTAAMLANEIRERMLAMPTVDPVYGKGQLGPALGQQPSTYNDVYDFSGPTGSGTTFSPPINALGIVIPNLTNWSQIVTVENVLPDNLSSTLKQSLGTTNTVRVTVTVQYLPPNTTVPETLTTIRWVVYE